MRTKVLSREPVLFLSARIFSPSRHWANMHRRNTRGAVEPWPARGVVSCDRAQTKTMAARLHDEDVEFGIETVCVHLSAECQQQFFELGRPYSGVTQGDARRLACHLTATRLSCSGLHNEDHKRKYVFLSWKVCRKSWRGCGKSNISCRASRVSSSRQER